MKGMSCQALKTTSMTLRVAGHFLFVARIEALDLQVGQQLLDFAIGELAALDPCRGADAFSPPPTL